MSCDVATAFLVRVIALCGNGFGLRRSYRLDFRRLIDDCRRLWQSLTKAKKQSETLTGLRIPSQSTAKTFCAPKNSSASYARSESASNPTQRTNRASRRSSSADRFFSRFSAFSTFASVSVTEYPCLPSPFRPAPFRAPPHENILSFLVDIILNLYHYFEKAIEI